MSSCCPAFVDYVKKEFPELISMVSETPSPMFVTAKEIKEHRANAKVVFIGPCTAKKGEAQNQDGESGVDTVITFEELQALFDSRNVDITELDELPLQDASYYGRILGRSGGLSEAIAQSLKEQMLNDFDYNPLVCDGIEECRKALLLKQKNVLKANFVEGMVCKNGCVGGAGCLTHGTNDKSKIDEYGRWALTEYGKESNIGRN